MNLITFPSRKQKYFVSNRDIDKTNKTEQDEKSQVHPFPPPPPQLQKQQFKVFRKKKKKKQKKKKENNQQQQSVLPVKDR